MAAIRLLKQLEAEQRFATPEEQAVLARYVGWGGLKNAFYIGERTRGYSYGQSEETVWVNARKELAELLTDSEYEAARSSTLNAHYTSPEIVRAMWEGARALGFDGGRVLEPAVGSGNFFGMMPLDLREGGAMAAVEKDELTARLAKLRGFLFDPTSNHLSNTQRALLQAQASAMETYLVILNLRVAYAGEAGHG